MKTLMMIPFSILFIIAILSAQEQQNIIEYYPVADSMSAYPKLDIPLSILCQKKVSDNYVTFIGYKDQKKIFIVAVTKHQLENPNKEIYRAVDFDGAQPILGKVTTWGYVFDRNNDGKIDYLALVGGAGPFLDERIPESFPVRGEKLTMPDLEIFIGHCKIIFNHWADDNYDGKIDGVIHVDIDPLRDWVKRKIVARSTKFNNTFDDVWAFRKKIIEPRDSVAYSQHAVPYRPLGKISGSISKEMLQEITDILTLVNKTATMCSIGKDVFSDD